MGAVADAWGRLESLLGLTPESAGWLSPATPDQLAAGEDGLGSELPDDLVEFYRDCVNGCTIGSVTWMPVQDMHYSTTFLHEQLWPTWNDVGFGDLIDSRALYVASGGQYGILYVANDRPGRLLWMDAATPPVTPLAPNLSTYLEAVAAIAEAGFVSVNNDGLHISQGDEVDELWMANGVAAVQRSSIEHWLSSPAGQIFTIE